MSKQQLITLCLCNFVIFTGISGLIGLMPIYLRQLGADSTLTGFFLGFSSLSLAVSTIVGGQLADRLQQRRGLLILCGLLAAPLASLLIQTTNVMTLMLLIGVIWFVNGTAMTMVNSLGGLFSEEGKRGRFFGMLSLSGSLGLFFGALINGRIVDRWGFQALFLLLALFYLLIPLVGLFVRDKFVLPSLKKASTPAVRAVLGNRTFLFLLLASIIAQAANSLIFLSRPLIMNSLRFDATTIASAAAIGGLLTMPLPLVIGWLADRLGRKQIIIACFLTTPLALVLLSGAADLWQFALASALGTILGFSAIVGSALVTDTFPKESLGTTLSLLNVTPWIGIVFGLSAGGVAINAFQMIPTLMLGVLLSVAATLLLLPITTSRSLPQPEAA